MTRAPEKCCRTTVDLPSTTTRHDPGASAVVLRVLMWGWQVPHVGPEALTCRALRVRVCV